MFYPYQVKAKRIGLEKAYFTPKEALDFSVWEQDTTVKIPGRIDFPKSCPNPSSGAFPV